VGGEPAAEEPESSAAEFRAWFQAFPNRRDRARAEVAYLVARSKATAAELMAGAQRFSDEVVRKGTPCDYVPLARTWLGGERWLDELPPTAADATAAAMAEARARSEAERAERERARQEALRDRESDAGDPMRPLAPKTKKRAATGSRESRGKRRKETA